MAVVQAIVGRVAPGRWDDYLALTRNGAKLVERHGGKSIRLVEGALSGEAYGTTVFTTEFANMGAFGQYYDEVMADEEVISVLGQLRLPNSPVAIQSIT